MDCPKQKPDHRHSRRKCKSNRQAYGHVGATLGCDAGHQLLVPVRGRDGRVL